MFTKHKKHLPLSLAALAITIALSGCGSLNDFRYGVKYEREYPKNAHRSVKRETSGGVYHLIRKGETLFRISKVYDINLRELMRINRIADPTDIPVGKSIWIPGASEVKRIDAPQSRVALNKGKRTSFSSGDERQKVMDDNETPYITNKEYNWPVEGGVVTSTYGIRDDKKHDGIDISAPIGRKIFAVQEGVVLFSGYGPTGYGKLVIVKHDSRLISVYAHCSDLLVRKGQSVTKGQVIAKVGDTGRASGPHLHFEVRVDRKPQNPLKYIPDHSDSTQTYAQN